MNCWLTGNGYPASTTPGFPDRCRSGVLQIGSSGFAAPPVSLDVESQLLALDQAAHSRAFNGGDVDEDVGSPPSC